METKISSSWRGLLLSLTLIFHLGWSLAAQNQQVTGVVKDAAGEPLAGASILVEGTVTGTQSDIDGRFSLPSSKGQVLVISFIGFETVRVPVTDQTFYEVVLDGDANFLDDVVVVGYDTQKKVNLTGAVGSL